MHELNFQYSNKNKYKINEQIKSNCLFMSQNTKIFSIAFERKKTKKNFQ